MEKKGTVGQTQDSCSYVSLLLPELRAGGAQKVFLTLAKDFAAAGLKVDLVILANEGDLLGQIPKGVRFFPLSHKPFSPGVFVLLRVLFHFISYVRKNQPDVILSTLTGTNLFAVIAHFLAGGRTRLVLREASTLANIRHWIILWLMRFLYKKADSVIVLSDFMKKEMVEKIKLSPEKICKVLNPVDLPAIQKAAQEPLPADFDTSYPYAVAVGRLTPAKDYETMINAFAEVSGKIPLRLVILGEGPDRADLEKQIDSLNMRDTVELRGFDPNPYRWLARAAVFVMSSRWEGCPNVLLESLALGKPVVSTCYDDSVKELISNQRAILVPVGNHKELADAICRFQEKENRFQENYSLPNDILTSSARYLAVFNGFEKENIT